MEQRLKSIRVKKVKRIDRYISGQPFTVVTPPDPVSLSAQVVGGDDVLKTVGSCERLKN